MAGGASATQITNWGSGTYLDASKSMWEFQQANYDKWASKGVDALNSYKELQKQEFEAYKSLQEDWNTKWAVAQAAIAGVQTLLANNMKESAMDAAQKQYDIANRQMKIAETEHDRYQNNFAPFEDKTMKEVGEAPQYTEDIERIVKQAGVSIRSKFTQQRDILNRRRTRYCVGAHIAMDRQLAMMETLQMAQMQEQARRIAQEREFKMREYQFNQKVQMFNIGKNIQATSLNTFSSVSNLRARGDELALDGQAQFQGALMNGITRLVGAFLPSANDFNSGFAPHLFSRR